MEVLLGVKIGCLLALLVFTLGCGLTPIYVKWFQMDAATGIAPTLTLSLTLSYLRPSPNIWLWFSHIPPKTAGSAVYCSSFIPIDLVASWRITSALLLGHHHRVLSLLGCTSAGVFLGAGLMHMTAEALEGIESEIQKFVVQVGSTEIKCQGYGAGLIDRSWRHRDRLERSPRVGQQLLGRNGSGGRGEHPRKAWCLKGQAGQGLELPQTQSNFCFCLPRIVQEVRGILLVMLLPVT